MKKNILIISVVAMISIMIIIVLGTGDSNSITVDNEKAKEVSDLNNQESNEVEEKKREEIRQEEERRLEEAKEQERIAEANRIEEERKQKELQAAEANRIAEEQKQATQTTVNSYNNFQVGDGTASHDHSTGYDSPYSDPNEPVITEEYGYIVSGNSYIHKTPDCKFIRGNAATQVPVSSSGKASCNCWYY